MPLRDGPGMTKDSIPGLGQHGGELWLSLINYKPGFLDTTRRSSLMRVVASSIVAPRSGLLDHVDNDVITVTEFEETTQIPAGRDEREEC